MNTHEDQKFFMVSIPLFFDRILRVCRSRYKPLIFGKLDTGYLLHLFFTRVFQGASPKPFFVFQKRGTSARVLGYSDRDATELLNIARQYATPEELAAIKWSEVASKPMPRAWPHGKVLRFDVLACPIARSARDTHFYRKGAEVDVFLQRCTNSPKHHTLDRETVYCEWCRQQVEKTGAARILDVRVKSFRLVQIYRNAHKKGEVVAAKRLRPEVRFTGFLEVLDSDKFSALVRRGVGRHRAFGFGMLLLAPPSHG